jgi:uncharacterized tellurite resistance protein B-like protein
MDPMKDRILDITDLLMGAAHADNVLHAKEEQAVRSLLAELIGGELPAEVDARIKGFDKASFVLEHTANPFAAGRPTDRRKLLELVAAVHDADEEIDLAEDEYLGSLARALGLPDNEVVDLKVDYEIEDLRDHLREIRTPPPIPR